MKYPLVLKWHALFDDFFRQNHIYLGSLFRIGGVYKIGDIVTISERILVEPFATLVPQAFFSCGCFSYSHSRFPSSTSIGRYCSISGGVSFMGPGHPIERITTNPVTYGAVYEEFLRKHFDPAYKAEAVSNIIEPVKIGNDVWIGENVLLKNGITIGDGAVIASRSIITRDVPPYSIVAGAPAIIRRLRFDEDIISRLQNVEWWRYKFTDLPSCWSDPAKFLDQIEERIHNKQLNIYEPAAIDVGAELFRLSTSA